MRKTGIQIIGDVAWGTHFCQFYQTKQDLIDSLVPYFKAGLKNNEFCMWVTSEPLAVEEAKKAMAKAIPNLQRYLKTGQIEIIPHTQWYLKGGTFNSRRVLNGWTNKLNRALAKGYAGLRLTGNTFWLEKKDWNDFTDYEEEINNVIGRYKIIALCTYSLDKCGAREVIDVVRNHQFALIKRAGKWEIIQSSEKKKAEKEIIHLASFPELNPRPVCEVDFKGNIRYMNPAIKRLFPEIANTGIKYPWFVDFKTKIIPEFKNRGKKMITRELAVGKYHFEQVITYIPERECIRIYGQDITERKRAEEAIATERGNLQRIFDTINVSMLLLDDHGIVRRANNAVSHWLNKDSSAICGAQPGNALGCIHVAGNSMECGHTARCRTCSIRSSFESVLRLGKPIHDIECKAIFSHDEGEQHVWLDLSADPVVIEGKRYVLLAMSNITERKKTEEKLWKLNRTLKALSDSSQAMMRATDESDYLKKVCRIIINDCGHAMVWVGLAENDEFKTVRPVAQAGFEKGYLKTVNITWSDTERGHGPTGTAIRIGKPAICINMLTDPDFKPWREEAIKRGYASSIVLPLLNNGKAFGVINIYSKEPNPFSKEEVKLLSELSDDLAYGIMAIRLQVERRRSEEILRQTRDYLESLFNYANAPIICWDVKFKITRFNRAFEHLTNYQAKEVIGKDLSILFPNDSNKESLDKIKRTLRGEHWEVVEIPILRKDGGIRTVLWNSANVYAEDGKALLATIAQGHDITARKKMAEALKKVNDELELKISQRTEELMRAQNELIEKRRLSDIGTLAATVAHELRNPLAAMRMAAYNIKRKAQNPILDKHLENIEIKINESEQIINNLLFYSRLKKPSFEQVNLYSVLEECIVNTQEHFSELTVRLAREFEAIKDISIEADSLQMKEMFNNILNNAYDAVSGKDANIKIVGEVKDSSYVKIIIKDSGIGIDEANLPKVFEPFFSTKAKGTGLGLSVCHQVVKHHNGRINIESIKGRGTSVSVTLPFKRINP